MPIKKPYLIFSIVTVLLLCAAQVAASTLLILPCLVAFLALVGWGCSENYTLPVLLFFLPWSPILKTSPTDFSFFTFGLVLVCAISIIKKRFQIKKYAIVAGIALVFLTLLSKVMDGNGLSFDYIAFMMLIVLFPVVKGEWTVKKYDFYQVVAFYALGIVVAAFCALALETIPTIARYIRVDSYASITRRSGFYGDANFYTAQITSAISGCLVMLIKERKRPRLVFLGIITVLLLYCGFLSASKSFVLVAACALLIWFVTVLRMQGRTGLKITLLVGVALLAVFVATSALFGDLIDVVVTRFSYASDLESFTTGRVNLWGSYIEEILGDIKIFFIGKGFTNVKVNGRGSHNTLIQILFQFGFVGIPFLVYWIASFLRGASRKGFRKKVNFPELLIIAVGTFLPWFAIDALFFDEFFLLQWYMFSAIQQLRYEKVTAIVPVEGIYGRTEKK